MRERQVAHATFSSLWQLVLTFVAVHTKNTVQVTAVTAFNFAFLGYAVIEVSPDYISFTRSQQPWTGLDANPGLR
jgi:hypothetical protein